MTPLIRRRLVVAGLLALAGAGLAWWNLGGDRAAAGACLLVLPTGEKATAVADRKPATALPGFSVETLDGDRLTPKQLEGQVVVVNFWATWCPPCVAEIPDLVAVSEAYAERGVTFLGLSLDNPDREQRVREFLAERSVPYANAIVDMALYETFGGEGAIPTTFVYDRSGNRIATHVGLITRDQLERLLEPLVTGEA